MSQSYCFGVVAMPLVFCVFSSLGLAQEPAPAPTAPPAAAAAAPVAKAPPKEPYVLEDGGLYIQPIYWLNTAQPRLRNGRTASGTGDFQYGGHAKASFGAEIGIPAGRSNTLRFTYFRVQGNSSGTLAKDTTLFSQGYSAGDFVNATNKIQGVKISWDYLSYTWHKPSTNIRVKTLYEIQYITTKVQAAAPFKAITADASGTTNDNTASGSKAVVLPTFGMALGSQFGKTFRWDIRGSGFAIPRGGAIGDLSGSIGIRLGKVEFIAGERFLYFKTSPKSNLYVTDTLQGVYGGIRIAWKGNL